MSRGVTGSRFYATDPTNPDAPVLLDEYRGMRPGDPVVYVGPIPLDPGGALLLTEVLSFPGSAFVTAILNDGEYECSADNLRPEED